MISKANLEIDKLTGDDSHYTFKLSGDLDSETVLELSEAIKPLLKPDSPVFLTLVMRDIQYMDSTGIAAIISVLQKLKCLGGKLEISGLHEDSKRLLEMLGITALGECLSFTG